MATSKNSVTRLDVIRKAMHSIAWSEAELDVLTRMEASLAKPRKASDTPTKAQLMNANLADALVAAMTAYGDPVDAKWIVANVDGIGSPQKAVAVVKATNGRVVRFYEGRQAYYRIA